MTTTTAVIRAFTERRLDATRAAIDSVLQQTRQPDELLVVIDHNETLRQILTDQYRHADLVSVIANERRQGIGGGSNTALLRARGDVIAYLDDDAVAHPEWLAALTSRLKEANVVGVGGRTVPDWIDGEQPEWFPGEFLWAVGCSIADGVTTAREIRNVWGGNNAFLRQTLIDQGGFIEEGLGRIGSRPVGGEDTEICIRIRQADPQARFFYEPDAVIHHQVPPERATLSYFRSRCFHEGMSKALLSSYRGNRDSLNEEVDYTRKTLVSGVHRSLSDAFRQRRPSELRRAAAIGFGLGCAAAGLVYGRIRLMVRAADPLPPVEKPLSAP